MKSTMKPKSPVSIKSSSDVNQENAQLKKQIKKLTQNIQKINTDKLVLKETNKQLKNQYEDRIRV